MAEMQYLNAVQERMQKNCHGCMYFSGWNCDYILMEKHRRPCRPGDDCTVRKKRDISRRERLALMDQTLKQLPPKPECSRMKKPYTVQVKHPRPVTHQKTVNKKTVFNQTKKPDKEPKVKGPSAWEVLFGKLNTPEVIRMYESGDSDKTIGEAVGCCGNSVRKWRIQTGRPPRSRKGPKSSQRRLDVHLEPIKAALAAGATTVGLAREYGVHPETIRRFRKAHGLTQERNEP